MGISIVLFLVIVYTGIIECKTITLDIKDGSVKGDPGNPLHCGDNQRIQLNTYTYQPKNKDESDILNPELLFADCSWRQNCSLSDALVKNITGNTKNGSLIIKHRCPAVNSAKSLCNTSVSNRNKTLNLVLAASRSHRPNRSSYEEGETFLQIMCSCIVTGIFKLNVKDIRLHDFQNESCPSVTVNASGTCSSCSTVFSNCVHKFSLNTLVSDESEPQTGHIVLTGLSSLYSPSLIWIQILKRSKLRYDVSCSTSISTVPASPTTVSMSWSKVSTSSLTTSPLTQSTSPVSYGTTVRSVPADSKRLEDGTNEDSTSPVTLVVSVVVGCVIIAVVVVVIYCRKIRQKQDYDGTRISNPAYENTKDDNHVLSEVPGDRKNSIDNELSVDTEVDHYIDVADDDRYNEVKTDLENEYNKIQFKNTPIPFDDSYGHINQINCNEHEDYDHIKGLAVKGFQTYSNGHPQGMKCTDNDTSHDKKADQNSVKQTSEEPSMTYDHLGQTNKHETPNTDDLVNTYSHVPSKFNGSAGREKPNHYCTTSSNASSSNEPKNEENGIEHDYFVLEPNADNQRLSREYDEDDISDHPYFVLEPEGPGS